MQPNSSNKCVHHYDVEILNIFDPEIQLIKTKPMVKKRFKKLLSGLKKFKVQEPLVIDYKKRNDHKVFHSSTKLIATDSDIDKAFLSMHQSIMTKTKNDFCEDWIVLDVIIKHIIKIFE